MTYLLTVATDEGEDVFSLSFDAPQTRDVLKSVEAAILNREQGYPFGWQLVPGDRLRDGGTVTRVLERLVQTDTGGAFALLEIDGSKVYAVPYLERVFIEIEPEGGNES
jgi:hypothetical protein